MSSRTLPDGWHWKRIDQIAEVVGGTTPSRTQPEYFGGDIPWATPTDVTAVKGRYLWATKETITETGLRAAGLRILPSGSVLLTSRATIGCLALAGVPVTTNQGFQSLIPRTDVSSLWLYYMIGTKKEELERLASGSTFKEFSRESLRGVLLPVPPRDQQVMIAEILGAIDDAIEKSDAVIGAAWNLCQALSNELLTEGVPGWHREWKQVPDIGTIPACWGVTSIDRLVDQNRPICYGILMPGPDTAGGVPVIKVKDYLRSELQRTGLSRTTHHIDSKYSRSRVKGGDILVSIRGTTGRVVIVPPDLDGANITQDTARIAIQDKRLSDFVRHYLDGPAAQSFIATHTIGQAVKGINLRELRKLPVPLPPAEERDLIAKAIAAVQTRLSHETASLTMLRQIKQEVVGGLLWGRVRVPSHETGLATAEVGS